MAKRGHKPGHHGGGWKVAYADFVTSMMALFLVLWLVGSDTETKLAVQRYFRGEITQQGRNGNQEYAKPEPFENQIHDKVSKDLVEQQTMKRELEKLREQLNNSSQDGDDLIRYEFIADGVRITVIDSSSKPFFDPGTAHLTFYGEWVLKTTAWYLDRFPFMLEVEGHTQKGAENESSAAGGDWNLSTNRAIAARDVLQNSGLEPDRFWRVIGYADRIPLDGVKPEAEENRRITIVARLKSDTVQNLTQGQSPMKPALSRNSALCPPEHSEQPIKVIKAGQAGKFLSGGGHNGALHADQQKKPEIRLIQTGPDYCDLEVICACGESTQIRCWNSPATQQNGAN